MARIIDMHTHWYPKAVHEKLEERRAEFLGMQKPQIKSYENKFSAVIFRERINWHNLEEQLAHMDQLGHDVEIVSWAAQPTAYFTDLPSGEGRDFAFAWNEEQAKAQRTHSARFWGTAVLPFTDTKMSLEVLDHAAKEGLVGVNIPACVGKIGQIDEPRLEPLYDRIEELGLVMCVHPMDAVFSEILDGYGGALFASLGRIVDVSVTAARLILSGIMERHPKLKVFVSHTGGALPYQSGRMDKNTKQAKLPRPTSEYMKRIHTDIVSPHVPGMKFAIDYFGIDQVMYGSDFPCWDPAAALRLFAEIGLSPTDQAKIFSGNARRFFGLAEPVSEAARATA